MRRLLLILCGVMLLGAIFITIQVVANGKSSEQELLDKEAKIKKAGLGHLTFVIPQTFGAKANKESWASKNTIAFNKALATGKTVIVPEGTYYIDGTLKMTTKNQIFMGESMNTELVFGVNNTDICIQVGGNGQRAGQQTISNFKLRNVFGMPPHSFIEVIKEMRVLIKNIEFLDARAKYFITNYAGWMKVDRAIFKGAIPRAYPNEPGACIYADAQKLSFPENWNNNLQVDNCEFSIPWHALNGPAILLGGGYSHSIKNCIFDGCKNGAIDIPCEKQTENILIENCHFEKNKIFSIRAKNSINHVLFGIDIRDCYFGDKMEREKIILEGNTIQCTIECCHGLYDSTGEYPFEIDPINVKRLIVDNCNFFCLKNLNNVIIRDETLPGQFICH